MDNQKRLKLYKLFGAELFQKVVFKVEKLKYVIIDKFFPNIDSWYEKQCNNRRDIELSKKHLPADKKQIIDFYRNEQLKFRRELLHKENRNYHYDINHPTKFVEYLNKNKRIHIRGLEINGLAIAITLLGSFFFSNPYPILVNVIIGYELVSAFINFECINLQNYNLYRFNSEKTKNLFKKIEERNQDKNIKCYSEAASVVSKTFDKTLDVPKLDEVVSQVTTLEEKKQLLEYAKNQLIQNQNRQENKIKQKRRYYV